MNMMRLFAEVDMNSVMNNGMNIGERLADGGKMILLGMACVFAVIFAIWLMLTIFRFFVFDLPKMKSAKAEEVKKEVKPAPVKAPTTADIPNIPPVTVEDDTVTVAVITAAISAYLEANSEDGKALPFRVVSFKRRKPGSPWNS